MKLGNFAKTPAERKRYAIDYSDWLDTGETLTSFVFSVSPSATGGLDVDASSLSADSKSIIFYVSYGALNTTYTVDVQATTSGGQVKEDTVLFNVREDA